MMHPSVVEENAILMAHSEHYLAMYQSLVNNWRNITELSDCIEYHKFIWALGVTSLCISVSPFGTFRATCINELNASNVYLGDCFGLWTKTISEWIPIQNEKFGGNTFGIDPEMTLKQILVWQYKELLKSALDCEKKKSEQIVIKLKKLNY